MNLTRALGWRMGVLIAVTGLGLAIVNGLAVLGAPDNPALMWSSLAAAVFVLVLGVTLIWRGWRTSV